MVAGGLNPRLKKFDKNIRTDICEPAEGPLFSVHRAKANGRVYIQIKEGLS